jgi:antitoxin PrlF
MATASVTSKGQITIPIEVRKELGLKTGDRVEFIKRDDGAYALKAKTGSIRTVQGMWKFRGKRVTVAEMNAAIAKGWAGKLNSGK